MPSLREDFDDTEYDRVAGSMDKLSEAPLVGYLPAIPAVETFSQEELDAKRYNSLVKHVSKDKLADCIQMSFLEIKHYTVKAVLFDTYMPETGELEEVWVPKAVCSNLDYTTKSVYIWEGFAKDCIPEWSSWYKKQTEESSDE